MVNHVSRYFHQSFLMSLSLVCDTKISMLDLKWKRVILQVCKANMKDFVFDRYWSIYQHFLLGQNTRRTSRVSGIQNENKSQQFTYIHTIWGSPLLSISFHLNFFLVCEN